MHLHLLLHKSAAQRLAEAKGLAVTWALFTSCTTPSAVLLLCNKAVQILCSTRPASRKRCYCCHAAKHRPCCCLVEACPASCWL